MELREINSNILLGRLNRKKPVGLEGMTILKGNLKEWDMGV
jgi:hypothetical protein